MKFPLKYLLYLYSRCRTGKNSLYINYFKGLRLLVDWIGEVEIPSNVEIRKLSWYETNYEIQELSNLLNCEESIIVDTLRELKELENSYGHIG